MSTLLHVWHIASLVAVGIALFATGYVIGARDAKTVLRIESERNSDA